MDLRQNIVETFEKDYPKLIANLKLLGKEPGTHKDTLLKVLAAKFSALCAHDAFIIRRAKENLYELNKKSLAELKQGLEEFERLTAEKD